LARLGARFTMQVYERAPEMFQKVTQGVIAGSLLLIALIAGYFAIDYTRVKTAMTDAVHQVGEEKELDAKREAIEESRRRREVDRDRDRGRDRPTVVDHLDSLRK
jgi:Arc/MetJ family transcription regulator